MEECISWAVCKLQTVFPISPISISPNNKKGQFPLHAQYFPSSLRDANAVEKVYYSLRPVREWSLFIGN